ILNVGNIREATGEIRRAVITDIESLASAFTSLASSTAASEVELADVVMRLAPTGSTLGLALEDIAGIAATLKDVGMSNEIGGTAISRIFTELLSAAGEGGETLE